MMPLTSQLKLQIHYHRRLLLKTYLLWVFLYLCFYIYADVFPLKWWGQLVGPFVFYAFYLFIGVVIALMLRTVFKLNSKQWLTFIILTPLTIRMLDHPLGTAGAVVAYVWITFFVASLTLFFTSVRTANWPLTMFLVSFTGVLGTGIIKVIDFEPIIDAENPADKAHLNMQLETRLNEPGQYDVDYFSYGSGTDLHRPEFGKSVSVRTDSVDASQLLLSWNGMREWGRRAFWGFDITELPIQGRVWQPKSNGKFPVVLFVHGNHPMEMFSDTGYEYLGKHLASRGFVFISVDQNFLNGSTSEGMYSLGWRLSGENDTRAWMLLKHLQAIRDFQHSDDNNIFNKIDLGRVVLAGHSRGGEAAAIAAMFNGLKFHPDNGNVPFDFHFDVKGVVAFAPADHQYFPRGTLTRLKNINYLVIQGSVDDDAASFLGLGMYNRVSLDKADVFKSSLYIKGANHGQFNDNWGRCDQSRFICWSYFDQFIMPKEQQQQIAKTMLIAFADTVTKTSDAYGNIFRSYEAIENWLPKGVYVQNYSDGAQKVIANFEDDHDISTSEGGTLKVVGAQWKETWQLLKWTPLESHALELSWDTSSSEVRLKISLFQKEIHHPCFTFEAINASETKMPMNIKVHFQSSSGTIVSQSIHEIPPQLVNYPRIGNLIGQYGFSEPIFQYFQISIEELSKDIPTFDITDIANIEFEMDGESNGKLILDNIAWGSCGF